MSFYIGKLKVRWDKYPYREHKGYFRYELGFAYFRGAKQFSIKLITHELTLWYRG